MMLILLTLLLFFLLALWRPDWGIYLILALLPVYQVRFTVRGLPTTYLEWLVLLLAAAMALRLLRQAARSGWRNAPLARRLGLFATKLKWLSVFVAAFLAAGAVAVAVSPVTREALGIFKAYIAEGALFWILAVLILDSREKLLRALYALGILVGAVSLFGIWQYFTLDRLPPAWWGPGIEPRRIVSWYTYPNALALLITPVLAAFTALLLFSRQLPGLKRGFVAAILGLGLLALVLTFSRGAWIGYGLALLLLALLSPYRKLVTGCVVVGALILFALPVSRHRLLPVLSGTDPAGLERLKLYHAAGQIIRQEPILDAGLMGFRQYYAALRPSNRDDILNYPHNFFLNFWVETGLLGLLAVCAMLVWCAVTFKKLWRTAAAPLAAAVLAALVALVGHGQLDAPFFKNDLSLLFFFFLAALPILLLSLDAQE